MNERRTPLPDWREHDRRETLSLGARLTLAAVSVAVLGIAIATRWREEPVPGNVRAEGAEPQDYTRVTASVDAPPWVYQVGTAYRRCFDSGMTGQVEFSPCRFACSYLNAPGEAWALQLPLEACNEQPAEDRFNIVTEGGSP